MDPGESIDACPACACNASSDIPCSRNLVKHVCRNMWHVNRGSPARPRTPSITSSSPAVVNGIPRRGPFSTTKHASVGTSDGRSDTKYSPSASKNRPETGTSARVRLCPTRRTALLARVDVPQTQPQHLATPQPGQQHRQHDRPIPLRTQRPKQPIHLNRREHPRQRPRTAHQPHPATTALTRTPARQPPRHRIAIHTRIATNEQILEQPGDARQPPRDRPRRRARLAVLDPHHLSRRGVRCAAKNVNT